MLSTLASRSTALLAALLLGMTSACSAVDATDRQVRIETLDTLPSAAVPPPSEELLALERRHAAAPADPEIAAELAQGYYRAGSSEGDLRFIARARRILDPWWRLRDPPDGVRLMRANLRQYVHDFDAARVDLDVLIRDDPAHAQAIAVRAAIHLVQADYAAARADCVRFRALTNVLIGTACVASVDAMTGHARQSRDMLERLLARSRRATPDERQWVSLRLGEIAERLGDVADAERHYRQALAIRPRDQAALVALTDLLLDLNRPAEVITLLAGRTGAEHLLLRLVLAEEMAGTPDAGRLQAVAQAFAAARAAGHAVHEQEESRFALYVLNDSARALALALSNWQLQREPRDARAVLEAARAAGRPDAAAAVLDWMRRTRIEDGRLAALAAGLRPATALVRSDGPVPDEQP